MSLSEQDQKALDLGITTALNIGVKRGHLEFLKLLEVYADAQTDPQTKVIILRAAVSVNTALTKEAD